MHMHDRMRESDEIILYTQYVFPNNSYIHPENQSKKPTRKCV